MAATVTLANVGWGPVRISFFITLAFPFGPSGLDVAVKTFVAVIAGIDIIDTALVQRRVEMRVRDAYVVVQGS
jgi:hypothetical protein